MTIIGLCGNKRAGKDTFADHLMTLHERIQKYSFAGPLKEACRIIFCLNDEQIDGSLKETLDERWGLSPRQMFQTFGTDLVRNQYSKLVPGTKLEEVGDAFWVYRFQVWYKQWKKENPDKILIITDIRFPDELKVVKEILGTLGLTHLLDNRDKEERKRIKYEMCDHFWTICGRESCYWEKIGK